MTETGALPPGVTFTSNGNGTATIASTPADGQGGVYNLALTATNGLSPSGTQNFTLTISQLAPAVSLNAVPALVNRGTAVSLAAVMTTSAGAPAPTQPMQFYAGSTLLGSAALTGSSPTTYTATFSSADLPSGTQNIVATYPGDSDYTAASSSGQSTYVVANNLWIGNSNGTTTAYSATGAPFLATPESSGGTGVAIDSSGNVWSLNAGSNSLAKFTNSGSVTNAGYTGGGLSIADQPGHRQRGADLDYECEQFDFGLQTQAGRRSRRPLTPAGCSIRPAAWLSISPEICGSLTRGVTR